MSITIKEIAALAGCSIGTVDRALHNRGRVSPQLAMKINAIAREHGFEPSRAGRALAMARNPLKLGVIVHLTKTGFMQEALAGIEKAKAELESMGAEVFVVKIPSMDAAQQVAAMDQLLEKGAQGIAISPVEDDLLRRKIDQMEVPVITFNTDMSGSRRKCFVGLDNRRSGAAAAGLMGAVTGGRGKVAVITGHLTNQANSRRVEGFLEELQRSFPKLQATGVQMCYDEAATAREVTMQALETYPDLAGIFTAAAGQEGVCQALEELEATDRVKVVAYDVTPATIDGLKSGAIDFVIDQNTFVQGYQPPMILFEILFNNKQEVAELQYTDITIKTKYNL